MAKDPALLFYTSDFLTGTMFMTDEQVGIYIRLLCAQHQHGGYISKMAFNIVVDNHEIIREKFIECDLGFYNQRMKEEADKRTKFCESRRLSRTSNVCKSYVKRMEDENKDVIVIKDKNEYMNWEKVFFVDWNSLCIKYPSLSKVKEISGKRRDKLKKRYEVESFRNYLDILKAIEEQAFVRGENDRLWKCSFDWLIENDTNYLKILERKYLNGTSTDSVPDSLKAYGNKEQGSKTYGRKSW